jgi:ribosomal protein S3
MGQKVNPIGLRLGINRTWDSRWYAARGEYGKLLHEDMRIREVLMKELKMAAVSRIIIERPHKKCRVTIYSARPGVVIGKKGAEKSRARNGIARVAFRCILCVRMLTMASVRRTPRTARVESRSGSLRARFLSMIPWRKTSA